VGKGEECDEIDLVADERYHGRRDVSWCLLNQHCKCL
jgi:hypothetical protein